MAQGTENGSRRMRSAWWYVQSVLTLLAIWVLLSGKFDALHLGFGVLGALVIASSFLRWRRDENFPLLRFLTFVPWQAWQIVVSNFRVMKVVLEPQSKIRPSFVERDPLVKGERAMTLLGCAITLTPGTLTVEMDDGRMLIHALDDVSADDIEQDVMAHRVAGVFSQQVSGGDADEQRGEGGA